MGGHLNKQKPGMEFCLPFVFSIGVMLSVDTLALLGNFLGKTGYFGFLLIIISAMIYLGLLSRYNHLFNLFPRHSADFEIVANVMGPMPAFLLFFVKIIAVIFLSTGLLVSSGFVFNEVFLYWFPNFAVAFILLGLLSGIQFLPFKGKFFFQIGFVAISICGLLFLIVAGIIQSDQILTIQPGEIDDTFVETKLNGIFLPLLLFVGFDLGFIGYNKSGGPESLRYHSIFFAVFFMCILFILWGFVSLETMTLQKLASTSIPHMIAARNILGDMGRVIMGIIVISGSLAVVNALFSFISEQGRHISKAILFPKKINGSKILILLIALTIAGLMAGGLAGYEKLETFIRASLIFWMISYTLVSLSSMRCLKSPGNKNHVDILFKKVKSIIFLLILVISILILIGTDDKSIHIARFIGLSFLLSLIPGVMFALKYNNIK